MSGFDEGMFKLGLKFVLGVVGLVALVSLLGHFYRDELETMGGAILDQFGYGGIALGTFGWTRAHCMLPSFRPEEAARCVYGDDDHAPIFAKNALRTAFHGDVIDFDARPR